MEGVWDVLLGLVQVISKLGVAGYKSKRTHRRHAACYAEQMEEVQEQWKDTADVSNLEAWVERFETLQASGPPVLEWRDEALSLARLARVGATLALLQDLLVRVGIPCGAELGEVLGAWTYRRLHQEPGLLTPQATETIVSDMTQQMRTMAQIALEHQLSVQWQQVFDSQDAICLEQKAQWQTACCRSHAAPDMVDSKGVPEQAAQQWKAAQQWFRLLTPFEEAIEQLVTAEESAEQPGIAPERIGSSQRLREVLLAMKARLASTSLTQDVLPVIRQMTDLKRAIVASLERYLPCEEVEASAYRMGTQLQLLKGHVLHDIECNVYLMHALADWTPRHLNADGIEQTVRWALDQVCYQERKSITAFCPPAWVWHAACHWHWQAVVAVMRVGLLWCASIASVVLAACGLAMPSLVCQGLVALCSGLKEGLGRGEKQTRRESLPGGSVAPIQGANGLFSPLPAP